MRPHILLTMIFAVVCAAPAWAGIEEADAAYKRGDYATALRECQPLAEQGNHTAQKLLGRMYMEGRGVVQDIVQAEMWFILAAASGDPADETLRGYIARDYMTPAQVGEAERLAAARTVTVKTPQVPLEGKTFSKAVYITSSQFLSEVKEVALTFEPDASADKYITAAEQRIYVAHALARYGIAARPNSPVSLVVTFEHRQSTIRETTVRTSGSDEEDTLIHDLFVSMQFYVRAAALRHGKYHVLVVAPASGYYNVDWGEATDFLSKSLFKDAYVKKFKDAFAEALAGSLTVIATDTTGEMAPWYVNFWTEQEKASADAEFTRIMRPQSAVEKRPFDGLDVVPQFRLVPDNHGEKCTVASWDASWQKPWDRAFQRLGWVDKQEQAALTLKHLFYCYQKWPPPYYWLVDIISLTEHNVVFELNGQLVRRSGQIFSSHRSMISVALEIENNLQEYLPRSISEFVTDLVLGNPNTPVVAVPSDPRPTIPSAANRESLVQPAAEATSPKPGPSRGGSAATVPAGPVPRPAPNADDPIGGGGFIRPPVLSPSR